MEAFFDAVFCAGPPSLGLRPRPDTLDAQAVRKAVAAHAKPGPEPSPDRMLLLEGIALLWHDHWNEAHETAQAREGERDFDLLHAILHRREGDFANSEYWFRQAGKHPCYLILDRRLAALAGAVPAAIPAPEGRWSPTAFIGRIRAEIRAPEGAGGLLAQIQAEELRAFAEWLLAP